MSQPRDQSDAKRMRGSEDANSQPDSVESDDRSVRQRVDATVASTSASVFAPALGAQAFASSVSAAASSSSTPPLARLSLMRLAVVERQLIMQGLDLSSLARLASTCGQLRGEALHREAGKFIPHPAKGSSAEPMCVIDEDHSAHASALFRAHVPVTLVIQDSWTLDEVEALQAKAATFSRITQLMTNSQNPVIWTEARMLQLLAQPWIQRVQHVRPSLPLYSALTFSSPCIWLRSAAVQHALFSLSSLTSMELGVGPGQRLLKSAVVQARKLSSMTVYVDPQHARSIRALRFAPSLTSLSLGPADPDTVSEKPLGAFISCLPPTLRTLSLNDLDVSDTPRPVLKAVFRRMPLLRELRTNYLLGTPLIQGMLDAGLDALPELRRVEFTELDIAGFSAPLLRRFLFRFPNVSILLEQPDPVDYGWEAIEATRAFSCIFEKWPRVQVWPPAAEEPPKPHPSDAESGSDVESVASSDPDSNGELDRDEAGEGQLDEGGAAAGAVAEDEEDA